MTSNIVQQEANKDLKGPIFIFFSFDKHIWVWQHPQTSLQYSQAMIQLWLKINLLKGCPRLTHSAGISHACYIQGMLGSDTQGNAGRIHPSRSTPAPGTYLLKKGRADSPAGIWCLNIGVQGHPRCPGVPCLLPSCRLGAARC